MKRNINTVAEYMHASEKLHDLHRSIREINIFIGNTFTKSTFNGFQMERYAYNAENKLKERMYKQNPRGLDAMEDEERWDMF